MIEDSGHPEHTTSPEELGQSYEALLSQQEWEVDGLEHPVARPPDAPASAAADAPPEAAAGAAPEPAEAPSPPMRVIEALLFVGGPPLTVIRAGEIIRHLTPDQFHQAIDALNRDYRQQARPYSIVPQGSGYVLTLRPRYRDVIDRMYGGVREARLSTAALDVLSLVAYRQPATKQEIDSLRGAESASLLRQLVRLGLVAVVQRGEAGNREVSYGTTPRFLELFGLRTLEDLPRTQDLQQI
jgi:segregation and condensation protein B